MICVQDIQITINGTVYDLYSPLNPQPSDVTTCTTVLQSGGEILSNPFTPSVSDGALIAGAIISVWGAAWAIKALILMLKGASNEQL